MKRQKESEKKKNANERILGNTIFRGRMSKRFQ